MKLNFHVQSICASERYERETDSTVWYTVALSGHMACAYGVQIWACPTCVSELPFPDCGTLAYLMLQPLNPSPGHMRAKRKAGRGCFWDEIRSERICQIAEHDTSKNQNEQHAGCDCDNVLTASSTCLE